MFSVGLGYEICVVLLVTALFSSRYCCEGVSLNIREIAHYLDYIPYRQEGFASLDDFRTLPAPPTDLRNRKMEIGQIKLQVGNDPPSYSLYLFLYSSLSLFSFCIYDVWNIL